MAEVSSCLRKGALDFAQKICHRYQLKYLDHGFKSAVKTASPSVGFLSGYVGSEEDFRKNEETASVIGNKYDHRPRVYSICNNNNSFSNATFGGSLMSSICSRRTWTHGQFVFVREYGENGQRDEPLYKTKTGYYDVLGVQPTATQAQIKTAYYKQSFIYHPDRNAGSEEATVLFSDINEAYTVLGNKVLRKKYDRGLLSLHDLTDPGRYPSGEDAAKGSAKAQADRRRTVMASHMGHKVYDFDKFMKYHYNEQLRKERDTRTRKEEVVKEQEKFERGGRLGDKADHVVVGLIILAAAIAHSCKE